MQKQQIRSDGNKTKTLRLILGDQLNIDHSWFKKVDDSVTYVMMEIRTETDYAQHHIQKVIGIFAAMQEFANDLQQKKIRFYTLNLMIKTIYNPLIKTATY